MGSPWKQLCTGTQRMDGLRVHNRDLTKMTSTMVISGLTYDMIEESSGLLTASTWKLQGYLEMMWVYPEVIVLANGNLSLYCKQMIYFSRSRDIPIFSLRGRRMSQPENSEETCGRIRLKTCWLCQWATYPDGSGSHPAIIPWVKNPCSEQKQCCRIPNSWESHGSWSVKAQIRLHRTWLRTRLDSSHQT